MTYLYIDETSAVINKDADDSNNSRSANRLGIGHKSMDGAKRKVNTLACPKTGPFCWSENESEQKAPESRARRPVSAARNPFASAQPKSAVNRISPPSQAALHRK
jgi:hypothetical protein